MATKLELDNLALVVPMAQAAQRRFGVPASITLAQWTEESGWGQSELSRKANNYFGVKAIEGEAYAAFNTREVVDGCSEMELCHFAFYKDAAESFARHAQLLASLPRYDAFMRAAKAGDIAAACNALYRPGRYSSDAKYPGALLELIREHNLTQYDVAVKPYLSTT